MEDDNFVACCVLAVAAERLHAVDIEHQLIVRQQMHRPADAVTGFVVVFAGYAQCGQKREACVVVEELCLRCHNVDCSRSVTRVSQVTGTHLYNFQHLI